MLCKIVALLSAGVVLGAQSAGAEPATPSFAGKTVRIVIGTPAGGEYDLFARLAARHIGRFLPGTPGVIVQSMPGAGGLTAIRYMAKVAPRDGTVVIVPQVNIVQEGMLDPNAQYDPRSFQWIGRMTSQVQVGLVSSKSMVRTLEGAKTTELIAGGYGNNPTTLNPRILNLLAGTKFKIVTGYKGTGEVVIAWERGEVDVVTNSWDILAARFGERIKAGLAFPIYVNAVTRPGELAEVPLMTDFGRTEAGKAFLSIYAVGAGIGRALAAPPGVPDDVIQAWRGSFTKMLDDAQFKADVSKGNIRLDPLGGEALARNVAGVVAMPSETVDRARKFYDELLQK